MEIECDFSQFHVDKLRPLSNFALLGNFAIVRQMERIQGTTAIMLPIAAFLPQPGQKESRPSAGWSGPGFIREG